MTPQRSYLRFVAILILAGVGACSPSASPMEPGRAGGPGNEPYSPESGPESTTAVPSAVAASRVFDTAGDPDCCNVPGGPFARFGFRLADVSDGFHTLSEDSGVGTCNNPPQDFENGITLTQDGSLLGWSSTMPVGAVIVGSVAGARVYAYSPRSWGDTGLRAAVDPSTGLPAEISSLEICYDYALRVRLEVEPTWTRVVQWSLQQDVTPDSWNLFPGDRGFSRVKIDVAPTGTVDSPPIASGTVTIENASPLPATISSITNIITQGMLVPVDCSDSFPFVLSPGQSRACTYTRELPDASIRTNLVSVNTTSVVRGGSGQAAIVFGEQTVENASVHIQATDGATWGPFDATASFSFDRPFDCAMLEGESERSVPQQVTIVETSQLAEKAVALHCLQPNLSHELAGSFRRTWRWSMKRSLEIHDVILPPGQSMMIDGSVVATASAQTNDFQASGTIVVHNPHPTRALLVTELQSQLLSEADGSLDCAGEMEVPPGESVSCALSMSLPDGSVRASVIRMSYQNHNLLPDGSVTATAVSELEHAATLSFDELVGEVDRCAEVRDDMAGVVASACVDAVPATFPAAVQIGPYAVCGVFNVDGMAELVALDSGSRTASPYHIGVQVTCESGCTRGTGYWKSHAPAGPPPYDSTWESLPDRGATLLFSSGMSYVEVMWQPTKGRAWIQLAQPWIAAHLNQLAGADASVIAAAFAAGELLLRSARPNGAFTQDQEAQMRSITNILESWNAGEIGPGSCPPLSPE